MSWHKPPKASLITALFLGVFLAVVGANLLIRDIVFVSRASNLDARVVEVRYETVRRGKGSVPGFVPVVEIPTSNGNARIPVDANNEEPVFQIGQSLALTCDLNSNRCIPNTFLEKWGDGLIDLGLAALFFTLPFIFGLRITRSGFQERQ
jgi:hypothetical protein